MKTIKVVAAVIIENQKVFATQRGYGAFKGGWEFPGGKIETGETPQQALKRELQEELDLRVDVKEKLDTIEYDYETFHLSMQCYLCSIANGTPVLKEHLAARWLSKEQLNEVAWLDADIEFVNKLKNILPI